MEETRALFFLEGGGRGTTKSKGNNHSIFGGGGECICGCGCVWVRVGERAGVVCDRCVGDGVGRCERQDEQLEGARGREDGRWWARAAAAVPCHPRPFFPDCANKYERERESENRAVLFGREEREKRRGEKWKGGPSFSRQPHNPVSPPRKMKSSPAPLSVHPSSLSNSCPRSWQASPRPGRPACPGRTLSAPTPRAPRPPSRPPAI